MHKKRYTAESAWLKISKWCAYQERSQQEVRDKLYGYGLFTKDVEEIIARLVTGNFLSEERFAIAFAGGKFRQLGWGKVKIRMALQQKKVSEYCIKKALASIGDNDYRDRLQKVLAKRSREEKEKHPLRRKQKLAHYLLSRGFEPDLVWDHLNND